MTLAKTIRFLIALTLLVPLASAAGQDKTFSHKQHLEEGAECDTCHQAASAEKNPTLKKGGCDDCHDDGTPAYVPARAAHKTELTFPHKIHEDAAECKDCHGPTMAQTQKAEAPLMAQPACAACHKENDVELDGCSNCHGQDFKLPTRKMTMKFPHPAHKESLGCDDCHKHGQTLNPAQPLLSKQACDNCHQENDVAVAPGNCAVCHGADQRKSKPADHDKAWMRRHGKVAGFQVFEQHGQECSLCHRNDSCKNCHRNSRPLNHNGLWRVRTHGKAAGWDREACKTCHETGSCIHCHRTTEPLNHKGAWRATHGLAAKVRDNEHCTVCHQPAQCAACHLGGN